MKMTEVTGCIEVAAEVLEMMDSAEQDRNSDDSIELDKSQVKSKHSNSTGQQKRGVTKKQSKEYLIQNLNNSHHEKVKIGKKQQQLKSTSRSDTEEIKKVAEDENNISSSANENNLDDSITDQVDNTEPNEAELVSSVYSNSSSQLSVSNQPQNLQQQQQQQRVTSVNSKHSLSLSPASPQSSNLKSASLKNSDKMSPGLAKRIQPTAKETLIETPTDIVYNNNNNQKQSTGSINGSAQNKQNHSKSLVTSTCSSSSSTTNTATVTPASSSQSTTSSSNSFHSATNTANSSSSAINAKIQNALERNMEKLNINTQNAKNNMKLNNGQINTAMTREELELFSNGNLKAQQGYFSGDSLSSTPEHHNKKIGRQNGQAQEFILNKQPNQDMNEYEEYLLEHQQHTTTKQQPQLSPGEQLALIDHKQRMLNRTSAEREMTPDSINNDEDILEVVTNNTNSRQKSNLKSKHAIVHQKKKIPLNQRPNGAPNTNKAQIQAIQIATPKTNGQQPTSKVSTTSNRQSSVSAKKTIPAKSTTGSTRVATQPTKQIGKITTAGKQQSMSALSQTKRQQQQIVEKTTNKKGDKAAVPKQQQQQQKPAVINKALMNAKVMPVVEEGLSNDELNDDDEGEEAEEELEEQANVPYLIEYEGDDQGVNLEEENATEFYNGDYEEEELEEEGALEIEGDGELEEGEEQFVDEEEYNNENEVDEYELEEDDDEDEENEEHVQQMKAKQVRAKPRPASTKNFVNQIQESISASRKYKTNVNNVNSKKSPVMPSQSNRIARKSANKEYDTDEETNNLLAVESSSISSSHINHRYQYGDGEEQENNGSQLDPQQIQLNAADDEVGNQEEKNREINVRQIMDPDNQVLIEGVLFRARYLGSTQLITDGNPTKLTRMLQAQEAVGRIKAPDGENQPGTDVDLFVSTEKIMVLNTDLEEIMMDHSLRSISYIADIGNLVVLMAKRRTVASVEEQCGIKPKQVKMICHVFESDEAQIVAQSIGQAFQVAYMEYLKANGIEDMSIMKDLDYQEVLNQQEIMGDELGMFAKKECQKEVIIPKAKNEMLGVVIVESGWGSMLPTVVVANMMPTGPAARCGNLNIGDQIISLNGISMVGLPLAACQTQIKTAKTLTLVRLVVVPCPPVVEVLIKRPDTKYQLGFSVQDGIICSLLRGGIAERGGVRVGHRIIEINNQSVVATSHEKIVNNLANSVGELRMKTMPTQMFRLLTGQEQPNYI